MKKACFFSNRHCFFFSKRESGIVLFFTKACFCLKKACFCFKTAFVQDGMFLEKACFLKKACFFKKAFLQGLFFSKRLS